MSFRILFSFNVSYFGKFLTLEDFFYKLLLTAFSRNLFLEKKLRITKYNFSFYVMRPPLSWSLSPSLHSFLALMLSHVVPFVFVLAASVVDVASGDVFTLSGPS